MKAKLYGCNIFEIFHMPDLTIPERWQDNPKKTQFCSSRSPFYVFLVPILIFIVATLTKDNGQEDEEVAAEDEEDMGVIETYSNYKPSKLKVTLSYCPIVLLLFSGGITNTCLDLILGWPATSRSGCWNSESCQCRICRCLVSLSCLLSTLRLLSSLPNQAAAERSLILEFSMF